MCVCYAQSIIIIVQEWENIDAWVYLCAYNLLFFSSSSSSLLDIVLLTLHTLFVYPIWAQKSCACWRATHKLKHTSHQHLHTDRAKKNKYSQFACSNSTRRRKKKRREKKKRNKSRTVRRKKNIYTKKFCKTNKFIPKDGRFREIKIAKTKFKQIINIKSSQIIQQIDFVAVKIIFFFTQLVIVFMHLVNVA